MFSNYQRNAFLEKPFKKSSGDNLAGFNMKFDKFLTVVYKYVWTHTFEAVSKGKGFQRTVAVTF